MKSAVLKEIELINYRLFEKEKIEFDYGKGKNLIIIQGKNGFGKSNIFNAITWCLFGAEQHLRPDDRSLPICNTGQLKRIGPDRQVETTVKIIIDTDEGEKEIVRSVKTFKNKDGHCYKEKPQLKITELKGKNWKTVPYPEYIISRLVPKDMSHFFFIDGEKLRQLFENINPQVIKKSIFDLSQITLLQNAIAHLGNFKSTFRKGIKGKEPSVAIFEDKLEFLDKQIKSDKERLEKLKNDRNDAYINKKKLDSELQNVDAKGVKVLEEQRKSLESEIDYIENSLKEKQQVYFDYLFKVAPILFTKKSIEKSASLISKMETDHKLPPDIQGTFLEELLSKGKCICGNDLKKNQKGRKALEKLLEDAEYSNISNDAITLRYLLKSLLGETGQYKDKNISFIEKIKELDEGLTQKQKMLKEVNTRIGSIDVSKVQQIHEDRQKYKNAIQECNGKIGRLQENIRYSERQYREIELMYKRELGKKSQYKVINEKIDICDKSITQLEIVKERIMHEIRNEIEKRTKGFFSNLISAKNFDDFKIREDYEVLIEKDGFNAVTSLSAAETLCLGYSFMSALRKVSGFAVPIVIDTPLAKIDKEYRVNVADWFKKALSDTQVILLVTDSEYTEEFKKAIKSSVVQEFLLKYDENKGTSEVKSYG